MHKNLNSKFPGEIFENSQADANCHKPYVPYRGNMNDSSSIKLESILPKSPVPPIIGIQANGNNAIASKLQVNNIINAPRINTKTIDNPSNLRPKSTFKNANSLSIDLVSSLDVVEYEDEYRLFMDLPTIPNKDIRVLIQTDGIRIEGKRDLSYKDSKRVIINRRLSGCFRIFIPCKIDTFDISGAKALYENGELCIHLKKRIQTKRTFPGESSHVKTVSIDEIYAVPPPKRPSPNYSL